MCGVFVITICRMRGPLRWMQRGDWQRFMNGVEVQIYKSDVGPPEPREMIPFIILVRALAKVNKEILWEVQAAVIMLMLFFTCSRSEGGSGPTTKRRVIARYPSGRDIRGPCKRGSRVARI